MYRGAASQSKSRLQQQLASKHTLTEAVCTAVRLPGRRVACNSSLHQSTRWQRLCVPCCSCPSRKVVGNGSLHRGTRWQRLCVPCCSCPGRRVVGRGRAHRGTVPLFEAPSADCMRCGGTYPKPARRWTPSFRIESHATDRSGVWRSIHRWNRHASRGANFARRIRQGASILARMRSASMLSTFHDVVHMESHPQDAMRRGIHQWSQHASSRISSIQQHALKPTACL